MIAPKLKSAPRLEASKRGLSANRSEPDAPNIYGMALGAAMVYACLPQSTPRLYVGSGSSRFVGNRYSSPHDLEIRRKKSDGRHLNRPSFLRVRDAEAGAFYDVTFHSAEPAGDPSNIDTVSINILDSATPFRYQGQEGKSLSSKREVDWSRVTELWHGRILPLALEHMGYTPAPTEVVAGNKVR